MIQDLIITTLQRLSFSAVVPALCLGLVFYLLLSQRKKDSFSSLPLVNGREWWQLTAKNQKIRFCTQAKEIIDDAFVNVGGKYRLQTENGIELMLSADYAAEIKDNRALSFDAHQAEDFQTNFNGFKPWRRDDTDGIFYEAIKKHLTQDISELNGPFSEEASLALDRYLTTQQDWRPVDVMETSFKIISQVSARIFLGEELCRNDSWLKVTVDYTRNAMDAAQSLRMWPPLLRTVVYWLHPSCRITRKQLHVAEKLVSPILAKRRLDTEQRRKSGLKPIHHLDAMQWMEDSANGRAYDPASSQIMMAIAANFTGSDMLAAVLLQLCQQPQLVEDMRKEIISVVGRGEFNKSALYKLRLMDSAMKETQRMKPSAVAVMRRIALQDTALRDGTIIPKGTKLMVSTHKSWDPKVYANPEIFDGYRFLRMRDKGIETAQFVSLSPEALGFGLGDLSCPGRFFATNELKIVLSHFLLKYDFKLQTDTVTAPEFHSLFMLSNSKSQICVRRRTEEVAL